MKSHNKYAKLPQDLDLSFQEQLDVDAGASDEFNLAAGIGLVDDTDDDERVTTARAGDTNVAKTVEGHVFDDEEDEIVIATALSGAGGGGTAGTRANVSGGSAVGLRAHTSASSGEKKARGGGGGGGGVAVGLGSDSVIEVSTPACCNETLIDYFSFINY